MLRPVAVCCLPALLTLTVIHGICYGDSGASNEGPLFAICVDRKWGFMDEAGNTVIPPQFLSVERFSEGLALVTVETEGVPGGLRGYINRSGEIVIKPQFDGASDFRGEIAEVAWLTEPYPVYPCQEPGIKVGYIDKRGQRVESPEFECIRPFSEDMALAQPVCRSGAWPTKLRTIYPLRVSLDAKSPEDFPLYVDRSWHALLKPALKAVDSFHEGLALVVNDRQEYGYIDKTGRVVIEPKFRAARCFHEGLAAIQDADGRYGYIDKTGTLKVPPQYANAGDFSEGLAPVRQPGAEEYAPGALTVGQVQRWFSRAKGPTEGKWGYINQAGEVAISFQYEHARQFVSGLAPIAVAVADGKRRYGYIDTNAQMLIKPEFLEAYPFRGGLAMAIIERTPDIPRPRSLEEWRKGPKIETETWAYIARTGRRLWQGQLCWGEETRLIEQHTAPADNPE